MGGLAKRLRREARANPKKAAILGVLFLVAVYYWAPLVIQWTGKGSSKTSTSGSSSGPAIAKAATDAGSSSAPAGNTEASDPVAMSAETQGRQTPWQAVLQWIENDPRTRAAEVLTLGRDPFHTPPVKVVAVKKAVSVPKPVAVEVTPQSLNLVLTGTILGTGRHVARISGKSYERGKTIEVAAKDGKPITFTLVEVGPRHVVLQRLEKRYELKIESPRRSGNMELFTEGPARIQD